MRTMRVVVEVDVTDDMPYTEKMLANEVTRRLGTMRNYGRIELERGAYTRPLQVKQVSRVGGAYKAAVERFEKAVEAYVFRGAQMPDDIPEIEEEYRKAKIALLRVFSPLN